MVGTTITELNAFYLPLGWDLVYPACVCNCECVNPLYSLCSLTFHWPTSDHWVGKQFGALSSILPFSVLTFYRFPHNSQSHYPLLLSFHSPHLTFAVACQCASNTFDYGSSVASWITLPYSMHSLYCGRFTRRMDFFMYYSHLCFFSSESLARQWAWVVWSSMSICPQFSTFYDYSPLILSFFGHFPPPIKRPFKRECARFHALLEGISP